MKTCDEVREKRAQIRLEIKTIEVQVKDRSERMAKWLEENKESPSIILQNVNSITMEFDHKRKYLDSLVTELNLLNWLIGGDNHENQ